MAEIFKTFKPLNQQVASYVEYYYVDIKPENKHIQIDCFPHFNTTISLYSSHRRSEKGEIIFNDAGGIFQAFTPIHDDVLSIQQIGFVHRVVIVFKPLGVYHFFSNLRFTDYLYDVEFFADHELAPVFSLYDDCSSLTTLLDTLLQSRLNDFKQEVLEKAIAEIFRRSEEFSVEELSAALKISRQHINRLFREYTGVSVKKFHEIVRFRKTVNQKLLTKTNENFTQLASAFNFNDQSHLIKTYKNLTENAPALFFKKGELLGSEDTFWHITR